MDEAMRPENYFRIGANLSYIRALFIVRDFVPREFLPRDPRDSPTRLQNTRETQIRNYKNTLPSIWRDTERSEYITL